MRRGTRKYMLALLIVMFGYAAWSAGQTLMHYYETNFKEVRK